MPGRSLTAAQRRRVALSIVLAIGWLAVTLVLGFIAAVMSTSGSAGFAVVPFIVAAGVAGIDRARNRLTALGSVAVAIASIAVLVVAILAGANVWRGGGYVLACAASVVAVIIAASDIVDRRSATGGH